MEIEGKRTYIDNLVGVLVKNFFLLVTGVILGYLMAKQKLNFLNGFGENREKLKEKGESRERGVEKENRQGNKG